jgi:hypothetical protein
VNDSNSSSFASTLANVARYSLVHRRVAPFVIALSACQHGETPVTPRVECEGSYAIQRGSCEHLPATDCKGLCGYVVRRSSCHPVKSAIVAPAIKNGVVPSTATDDSGRFDLVGLPPGHYVMRVMAEQDEGQLELDVVEGAQPFASPIELDLFDRPCVCGGLCPN